MHQVTIGAHAVIFDERARVLLCHRTDADLWNLPGGGVEQGETPIDAVIREVWEETGFTVEVDRLVGIYTKPDDNDHTFSFLCRITGGEARLNDEADKIEYVPVACLPENIVPNHVVRIQHARDMDRGVLFGVAFMTQPSSLIRKISITGE